MPHPMNATDDDAMNEFLTAFGVNQNDQNTNDQKEDQGTDDQNDQNQNDQNDTDDQNKDDQSNQNDQNDQNQNQSSQTQNDSQNTNQGDPKVNQAFAQMRVQNKQMQDMLKGIGELLGVQDTSNPELLTNALNQKILAAQAQKQGISPELLQEIQNLKNQNLVNQQENIRRTAYLGFQQLKDNFQLDDKGLQAFADELVADGVNPFEQPVNLLSEYRVRKFDQLMAAAEERGAQAERERSANASKHGSTPNNKQGKGDTDTEKITTVSGLNKFFEKNG